MIKISGIRKRKAGAVGLVLVLAALTAVSQSVAGAEPDSARAASPYDLEGHWVSLVTEDWRYRIMTAEAGDAEGIPLSDLGESVAAAWDPEADEAAGLACRAYGAGGLMRMPTRLHITWEADNVLRIESDAGMQTRLLNFNGAGDETAEGGWQGVSTASWNLRRAGRGGPVASGSIEVDTWGMRPGYLRRNGIPYSDQATLKEYFDLVSGADGAQYLIVLSILEDPAYLEQPVITSSNFRKQADAAGWNPTPCASR